MTIKSLAAVAAVFGAVAVHGADLGRYMLPDADLMFVGVGDANQKGAYTKAVESAGLELDGMVKDFAKGFGEGDKKKAENVLEYIDLLTNGVVRTETALSLRVEPGQDGMPLVNLSAAMSGLKNAGKLLAKFAKDFPETLKLVDGVLMPADESFLKAKAWTEGGILRVAAGKAATEPMKKAVAPNAFASLLAKLSGRPYAGMRIKDPVGVAKRFVKDDAFAEMTADEQFAEVVKLRGIALDCTESQSEPVIELLATLVFDSPDTASKAVEKLIGYKQLGLMALREAQKGATLDNDMAAEFKSALEGVKIAANGPKATVKFTVNAKDEIARLKKLQAGAAK